MKRLSAILIKCVLLLILIGLLGCGEATPPAQPTNSVSKKIAVPPTQPAPMPVQAKAGNRQDQATDKKAAETPSSVEPVAAEPSDLVKESLQIASSYDPTGRFDPFEPLFKEKPAVPEVSEQKGKHEKRKPQTPLERVALAQLKVTAIIRAPSGNRALVEDATGKGYVVQKGTYIGLNSGQVIEIDKNRIVVEEEIENVMGELKIQNAELKLQKPAGEL